VKREFLLSHWQELTPFNSSPAFLRGETTLPVSFAAARALSFNSDPAETRGETVGNAIRPPRPSLPSIQTPQKRGVKRWLGVDYIDGDDPSIQTPQKRGVKLNEPPSVSGVFYPSIQTPQKRGVKQSKA